MNHLVSDSTAAWLRKQTGKNPLPQTRSVRRPVIDNPVVPEPFDLKLVLESDNSTTAILSNIWHKHKGIITIYQAGELSTTLTAADTVYIGIELTKATGAVAIIESDDLDDVREADTPPRGQATIKEPLWVVVSTVDGASVRHFVKALDARNKPVFVGYL